MAMFLTERDLIELADWRRALHRRPELSGHEAETARTVAGALAATGAYRIVTGLGGHGVAGVYEGGEPGPTVMFRAELDGLPIEEIATIPHQSTVPGRAHLCGHDGHMATLVALARGLGCRRPRRGRAVLLFQPAEENGAGAAAVLADPRFSDLMPDRAFALHNMPGLPLGRVALDAGPVNCASRGMRITLTGKTAHASMPEHGVSPMAAVASLMPALTALGQGGPLTERFSLVTVTHARMGEPAFGIAPGKAEVWATVRTLTDGGMAALCAEAERLARDAAAAAAGLAVAITYDDVFVHCENDPQAVVQLRRALDAEGVPHERGELPMRASEDFGRFGRNARAAMFFLGAGENHPSLHNPDYDYPDELIATGARVFMRTLRDLLG
jgi:amidohydrolase